MPALSRPVSPWNANGCAALWPDLVPARLELFREVLPDVPVEVEHVVVVELIENLASLLTVGHQPGGAEGAQLMGDGGFRGGQLSGEIADAVFRFFQQGDQPQPGGIGQHSEEFPHALGLAHAQRQGVCRGGVVVFLTNRFAG